MNPSDLVTFKRALENLGYQNKTRLTRAEIDRLVEELNLSREYDLADYVSSIDPAAVAELLR